MGSRRKGRILAFQALYAWGMAGAKQKPAMLENVLSFSWIDEEKRAALEATADFSRLIISGTVEKIRDVDAAIKAHLKNWDFSRLNQVDLALLRMSTYSLLYQTDMPPSVVIDEAIDISREYGTDDSYRFVNGVLDSIRKTVQNKSAEASA